VLRRPPLFERVVTDPRQGLAANPELLLQALDQSVSSFRRNAVDEEKPTFELPVHSGRRREPLIELGPALGRDLVWDAPRIHLGRIHAGLHETLRGESAELPVKAAGAHL